MIQATALSKQFRTSVRADGPFKSVRSLFSRNYTIREAVHDVSFTIAPGEFVGYIGPNGAGKSTTVKMLSGILHPTSGDVSIDGLSPYRDRRKVARRLGVLFGQRSQLWWDLPVRDSFEILAAMYDISKSDASARLDRLGSMLQLGDFMDTPVRKLSLGQRMRADIAAALLHNPGILFLDEPTIGLDVTAKRSIRTFLQQINKELGTTVLLTTHDMDDIEQLCSRVMVLNGGRLKFDGNIGQLRAMIGLPTLMTVTYRTAPAAFGDTGQAEYPRDDAPRAITETLLAKGLRLQDVSGNSLTVEFNRERCSAMDALRILELYGDVDDVHMEEPNFEDIVHRIY
ncbi:ABC transporter ATP-binding protein [Paenibacillus beijingensis]|uniref:ABC transporter ATP-binding protein n=1 Tax=Paenibacillus beijingensis TaxID=1126833 RepID=A0A0D5NKH2_9BACL|nr:ATP-binding cassette domain-containing protein [Paenibacillus beijingensis]AJY75512.1 ABC transporter ATP-binding protein [Paenibacillus beijingensis]